MRPLGRSPPPQHAYTSDSCSLPKYEGRSKWSESLESSRTRSQIPPGHSLCGIHLAVQIQATHWSLSRESKCDFTVLPASARAAQRPGQMGISQQNRKAPEPSKMQPNDRNQADIRAPLTFPDAIVSEGDNSGEQSHVTTELIERR